VLANGFGLSAAPEIVGPQVAPLSPAEVMHGLRKRRDIGPCVRIVLVAAGSDHSNAAHSVVLRARYERPRDRATEQRNELPPSQVEHAAPSPGATAIIDRPAAAPA
jgi:hypothetical protein